MSRKAEASASESESESDDQLPASLALIEEKLESFNREKSLPECTVPTAELLKTSQRLDLIRLAKSWGGLEELAQLLGFRVCFCIKATQGRSL